MAANTPEAAPAAAPAPGGAPNESSSEATAAPSSGGGIKAWLPLIVTVVTMPALAYCTTSFVLMPKLKKEAAAASAAIQPATTNSTTTAHADGIKPVAAAPAKSAEKGAKKGEEAGVSDAALKERGVKVASNGKMTVPLNKILVNIAGSMGSRYLMAGMTLASDKEGFGEIVVNNEAQLLDLAAGVLSSKTISDLEKPEARTVVRAELQTVFNNVLGAGTIQDVYLTEFAIQ
jgi:flagellar protein FliL